MSENPSELLQIKISANQNNAELISDFLMLTGAVSVTFEDAQDQPIYEPPPGATPLWSEVTVVALFESDIDSLNILKLLEKQFHCSFPYRIETLPDQNWTQTWMENFHATRFGKKLWICPSHEVIEDNASATVILDPGLAFGTGTHPTTALCLAWLEKHIQGGETILDYGCGSGILAIAALKLGAQKAFAIDNDPQALIACEENARRNQISNQQIIIGSPEDFSNLLCDVVLANILANPLIILAEQLSSFVQPNGKIVLSGILSEQTESVVTAYKPWFEFKKPKTKENWVCLEGKKLAI